MDFFSPKIYFKNLGKIYMFLGILCSLWMHGNVLYLGFWDE